MNEMKLLDYEPTMDPKLVEDIARYLEQDDEPRERLAEALTELTVLAAKVRSINARRC